ncbi:6265_t:CDS:2 [Entrophospora sp. SA101]|nr:6265_t:CDS:2 [Entrophospora sp. SA101]
MHHVDDIYLVDQFDGFTISNTAVKLREIPYIIHTMLGFK